MHKACLHDIWHMKVSADDRFLFSFSDGKILNGAFYMCIFDHICQVKDSYVAIISYHVDRPLLHVTKIFKENFTPAHLYSKLENISTQILCGSIVILVTLR